MSRLVGRAALLLGTTSQRQRRWLAILASSFFVLVGDGISVTSGRLVSVDDHVWWQFVSLVGSRGFLILQGVSLVGFGPHSSRFLGPVAAVICFLAVLRVYRLQLRVCAALLAATTVGALLLSEALKLLVYRPGPSLTPYIPPGHTFPSGTAAVAVAFFGFLGYVAYHAGEGSWRLTLSGASFVMALAFVLSSLTYHYPTEVLGGSALGVFWLAAIQLGFWRPLRLELFGRRLSRSGTLKPNVGRGSLWPRSDWRKTRSPVLRPRLLVTRPDGQQRAHRRVSAVSQSVRPTGREPPASLTQRRTTAVSLAARRAHQRFPRRAETLLADTPETVKA